MFNSVLFLLAFGFIPIVTGVLRNTTINELIKNMPGLLQNFPEDCREKGKLAVKPFCPGDERIQGLDTTGNPPGSKKRRKRDNEGTSFWGCDFPIDSCCKTCRRRIPRLLPITIQTKPTIIKVYPVFCPGEKRGYQLVDEVGCLKQRCKQCRKVWTFYTFMVTDVEPNLWDGHCQVGELDIWFVRAKVNTHCICPKERSG